MKPHTIAEVKYSHGQPGDDAPITCACGWPGRAGDFAQHRRDVGVQVRGWSGPSGPALGTAAKWRLKRG